jgi:hypothetical protein
MGQPFPSRHPAVIRRSRFNQLRALLAVALIAVAGLTASIVIFATDDHSQSDVSSVTEVSTPSPAGSTRYDGGPEEGSAPLTQRAAPATFDPNSIKQPPGVRYDGGPEEGTRGSGN